MKSGFKKYLFHCFTLTILYLLINSIKEVAELVKKVSQPLQHNARMPNSKQMPSVYAQNNPPECYL